MNLYEYTNWDQPFRKFVYKTPFQVYIVLNYINPDSSLNYYCISAWTPLSATRDRLIHTYSGSMNSVSEPDSVTFSFQKINIVAYHYDSDVQQY